MGCGEFAPATVFHSCQYSFILFKIFLRLQLSETEERGKERLKRQTDRQRHRHRQRDRDRHSDRQTDRQTNRRREDEAKELCGGGDSGGVGLRLKQAPVLKTV